MGLVDKFNRLPSAKEARNFLKMSSSSQLKKLASAPRSTIWKVIRLADYRTLKRFAKHLSNEAFLDICSSACPSDIKRVLEVASKENLYYILCNSKNLYTVLRACSPRELQTFISVRDERISAYANACLDHFTKEI